MLRPPLLRDQPLAPLLIKGTTNLKIPLFRIPVEPGRFRRTKTETLSRHEHGKMPGRGIVRLDGQCPAGTFNLESASL